MLYQSCKAAALGVALSLSAPSYADDNLPPSNTELHDMACYTGMSFAANKADSDTQTIAMAKQNLTFAIFYYAGKVATYHPGERIPEIVKNRMQNIAEHLKTMDPKSCMTEVRMVMSLQESN